MDIAQLLDSLNSANDDQTKAGLIAEFVIAGLPNDIAEVARTCSILHWFTKETVEVLSSDPRSFDEIISFSFVEEVPEGYGFHALTRRGLINIYASKRPEIIVNTCKTVIPFLSKKEKQHKSFALELLYCLTILGDNKSISEYLDRLILREDYAADVRWLRSIFQMIREAEDIAFVPAYKMQLYQRFASEVAYGTDENVEDIKRQIATKLTDQAYDDIAAQNYTDALEKYSQIITILPNDYLAYSDRGVVYQHIGQWDKALQDFSAALEIAPEDIQLHYWAGLAQKQLGLFREAISDYSFVIANEEKPESYFGRGYSYLRLGNIDQAILDLTKALSLSTESVFRTEAYFERCIAYLRKNDILNAQKDCEEIRKLIPNSELLVSTKKLIANKVMDILLVSISLIY